MVQAPSLAPGQRSGRARKGDRRSSDSFPLLARPVLANFPSLERRPHALVSLGVLVAIVCGLVLPSLVKLYSFRNLIFLVLAFGLAAISAVRPTLSISVTVGAFVFSALLRRLVPAADPAVDAAAIVPFVVAIPLALRGVFERKPPSLTLTVAWISIAAALSFRTPLVGIAGWLNLAVPLLVAFAITTVPLGPRALARSTVAYGAIAATYGVLQYFVPFSWDITWLEATDFESVGRFGEDSFRPFATLPAPLTAAMLCVAVVLVVAFRSDLLWPSPILRGYALVAATVLLLLTQVRSAWVALVAALLVAAVVERSRALRKLVVPLATVLIVVLMSSPGQVILDRAQTLSELESDVSYQERSGLLDLTGSLLSPVGQGLGTLSTASRIEANSTVDNGYLVVLGEVGLVGLGLLLWLILSIARRARRPDLPFMVVLLVANLSALVLGGLPGLLFWPFLGLSRLSRDSAHS